MKASKFSDTLKAFTIKQGEERKPVSDICRKAGIIQATYQRKVSLDFSRPGKPTDYAFVQPFNGRFRADCLNAHWFLTLADATEKLTTWRILQR